MFSFIDGGVTAPQGLYGGGRPLRHPEKPAETGFRSVVSVVPAAPRRVYIKICQGAP